MKIGYFLSMFPYKSPITGEVLNSIQQDGGVENVGFNIATEMIKKNHEVYVFTSSVNSSYSFEDYGLLKIYRYPKTFNIGIAPVSISSLYKPLFSNIHLDMVHIHIGNLPLPLTGYFYSKINGKPLVTTYHEDYLAGYGSFIRKVGVFLSDKFLIKLLLKGSNVIITPSEYYINKSRHLSKVNQKVIPIYNGINFNDFDLVISKKRLREELGLPLDKQIILFLGSLTPRKAPDVLIKSMKIVLEKVPNCHLLVVGSGSFSNYLNSLAYSLNISKNITFTGFVDDETKINYYHASDLFVLPSYSEGFGIVLLEASACGLPLIVSDLDVFKSIVKEGENGLFTKTGDSNDVAEKIILLLKNDDLRNQMSKNAKEFAQTFSWEKAAEQTEEIYNSFYHL